MAEKRQHLGDMSIIEEEVLYVELQCNREGDVQSENIETMRSLKVDLESLNDNNAKLIRAKSEQ